MVNNPKIGVDEYLVRSYSTDFKQHLSLVALLNFLQESAWHHATNHAFGYEDLMAHGWFWALSRLKLIIKQYPVWGDKLRVETWSKAPEPVMAYRDFEVFNQHNESQILASSAWLIVDITTRRPQRIKTFEDKFPCLYDRNALAEKLNKLPALTSIKQTTNKSVTYASEIDINGHVNNTNYVRWVLNSFPISFLEKNSVSEIEINFMHEAKIDQQYVVNLSELSDKEYLCNVVRIDDNCELARVKLNFSTI